ncbi:MAG: hypothetical protein U0587_15905 [Candidatus Binatia bacterium]
MRVSDHIDYRWYCAGAVIVAAGLAALYPVVGNGFLVVAFDDDGFILDNPSLGALTWHNIWACLSRFYLFDYLPLPLLSYLLESVLWGMNPVGYHAVNLLLHLANAVLVYAIAARALRSQRAALLAGLVFALHPVQMEVVSVVAQRKTLLATALLLGALVAYQGYLAGRRRAYPVALLCYLGACASKSSVVPFPFLLLLYDHTFARSRAMLRDKLPFLLLAIATAAISIFSKAGSEVVKGPHGGNYLATAVAMSRVFWEYLDALLLPVNLSPSYYYSPREVFSPLNCLAVATLAIALVALYCWRRRIPLTVFFVAWFMLSLLPVANIIPIAVLRADRYLYLPMVAFAIWAGAGLAQAQAGAWVAGSRAQGLVATLPYLFVTLLGVLSWQYAHVWRSDVSVWTRVVERHPWNSRAHYLLAVAYTHDRAWAPARLHATRSLQIDPAFDRPRALLADIAREHADQGRALAGPQPHYTAAPAFPPPGTGGSSENRCFP